MKIFVGLTVPALPSSAGLPFPTPSIYLVGSTRRVSLSTTLLCLVYVLLSTGYGPRAIDDFSRQLPLFLRPLSSHCYPTLRVLYTVYSSDPAST
jgi:hypothetical protein